MHIYFFISFRLSWILSSTTLLKKIANWYLCCIGFSWYCLAGFNHSTILSLVYLQYFLSDYISQPDMFMSYVNPLSVLASTYLLLAFSKIKFYSKVVNKVAASAFAVYLLHSNYAVFETYFTKVINIIHTEYSGILYPIITLSFLVAVFILSVLADQLRIYSYAFIAKRAEKKLLNNGRIKNS